MMVREAVVQRNMPIEQRSIASRVVRLVCTRHGDSAPPVVLGTVYSIGFGPNPSNPWSAAAARCETTASGPRSSRPAASCCSHDGGVPAIVNARTPTRTHRPVR